MGKVGPCSPLTFLTKFVYEDVTHTLDIVPPSLLLSKIFKPYRLITQYTGLLPIQLSEDDGKASFSFFKWTTIVTLSMYCSFILDSCLFIPMYLFLLDESSTGKSEIVHVAEMIFVSCQYFGAAIVFFLSPLCTTHFIEYWNRLQGCVERVAGLTFTSQRDFLQVYLEARWNMKMWVGSSVGFCIFCVYSYGNGFNLYMGENSHPIAYYGMYTGLLTLPFFLSFHILHSLIFGGFCCTLKSCFLTLKNYCGTLSQDKFGDCVKLYEEINELVKSTGDIAGGFVAIEIIIMVICVTMNIFFIISKVNGANAVLIYLAMVVPYFCWFHWVCQVGESLVNEGNSCYKAVQKVVLKDSPHSVHLLEKAFVLRVRGYFAIRARLFTTVIGTITTYLIVMLQFKFSSPGFNPKDLVIATNDSIVE